MKTQKATGARLMERLYSFDAIIVLAAFVFFELFSIGSTANGFHAFFNNLGWWLILPLAAGLHCVGFVWLLRSRQTRRWGAVVPYMALCSIFILMSWSWHWRHYRGIDVANEDLATNVTAIEQALMTAHGSLSLIAGKTDELAKYSDSRANEESKHGGTCGDVSGPTRGKRFWIRSDDQRLARSVAGSAQQHLARVDQLLADTRNLAAARESIVVERQRLTAIGDEVKAFGSADPVVIDIHDRAKARLDLSANGYRVPGYGMTRCPDPTRDEFLTGVVKAAQMPAVTLVDVLDPESLPEAQKRIWGRAAHTLWALWARFSGDKLDPVILQDQLSLHDLIALLAASLIELGALSCLLWLPRPRRDTSTLAEEISGLTDGGGDLLAAALEHLVGGSDASTLLNMIDEHLWWHNPTEDPFLVVPIAPRNRTKPELFRAAELLAELGLARIPYSHPGYAGILKWGKLDAPEHLSDLARCCKVRLYQLDQHAYRQAMLSIALRGLRNAKSEDGTGGAASEPQTKRTEKRPSRDNEHQSAAPLLLDYRPLPAE